MSWFNNPGGDSNNSNTGRHNRSGSSSSGVPALSSSTSFGSSSSEFKENNSSMSSHPTPVKSFARGALASSQKMDLDFYKKENSQLAQKINNLENLINGLKKSEDALKTDLQDTKSKLARTEGSERQKEQTLQATSKNLTTLKAQIESLNQEKANLSKEREKLSASLTRTENEKNRLEMRLNSDSADGKRGTSFLPVRSNMNRTNNSASSSSNDSSNSITSSIQKELQDALNKITVLEQENASLRFSASSTNVNTNNNNNNGHSPVAAEQAPVSFRATSSRRSLDNDVDLRKRIAALDTQCCRLENEKISLQRKFDREREEMDTKLKESKRDLTDARRSCDDLLKSKKADLEKLTKEYSNEKAEILRKMDALSADVTRSNASVKDQQAKFSTLESAHSTLTTKFSSAEAEWNLERQTLETNIETWSNKVSSLSLERDAATEKVVKLEAANLSLQSQIEQLEKVQALDPSNIQQLVADNDDLKAQLSAAKDEALAQMNLIASLEQKVVGKEDAVSLLTKDKQQLAESIADLRANVDDMEKRLSVQTSQLDQTKGSLLNSEMSREEAQGKLERLQSDVSAAEEELAKRISSLEQERQQLIDTVSVLKNQASAFAEEKKKLSEQVSDLQTQLENSLHGNSSLTTQVDILNNRISQIMSQIETLEQLNSTVLREKEQVVKYLAAKEEEAAERISILQGALMRKEDLLEETGKKLALLEEQVLNSTNSKANTDHETAIELSQQSVIEAETQSQLASLKEQLALMDSNYKCCKLELGNTKNARAALETEISKIKTDYSILEDEFEELATSQESLADQYNSGKAIYDSLKQQLETQEGLVAEKNRELQQLKSEKESLQALLDAARQATSEEGQIANDRIVGLENEISSLITSKSALALKICVLEADLATNQRETDRLESLCATQTTSLESLSRIEKEYSTKLFNSETSRKAISDELDGLKKSCVHVQDKLDQALRKNASLVEEFAAKSAQTERDIMSKEEALQESKSSIVKLESSLTYLQAQLSGKVNELEVVTANMAESARTLLELQHSSATLTSENESLKSSLDDIKESNVQLEARLKEVIDSSEHQLSTSSEHTSLIKQLEADMDSLKSAIESKSKELDVLNHDLTCSKNVSSQLQSQLQEAQQHAEELEKVKVDLDQANMDLKTLLQQQRDSLSAESSCAQKQLQEQAQSLMEREKEISDLTSSLAKERNSLEQLQEALSSQEKSRELLQADIEELSIKHDAVSSELKSTLEIMSEKKSLEKEMEDIIDGLSNENNKLTGRLDQVEEELIQQGATAAVAQAELESQVARLTSSETLLKGELETLVVESRKKSTTISELKKEVARWEQDLALAQDTLSKTETERGKLVQQLSDARMQLVNMQSVLEKSKQANETSLADLEKDIVQKNSEMDQLQRSYNDIQSKSEKLLEEYQSALETLGVAKSACENDHVSKMILTELQTSLERLSGELADCHKEIETLKAQGDEKAEQTKAKLIEWKGLAEQANSRYETLASETAVEKDRLKAALISADCKANVIDTKYQACLLAIEKLERDIGTNGKTSGEAQRKLVQMAIQIDEYEQEAEECGVKLEKLEQDLVTQTAATEKAVADLDACREELEQAKHNTESEKADFLRQLKQVNDELSIAQKEVESGKQAVAQLRSQISLNESTAAELVKEKQSLSTQLEAADYAKLALSEKIDLLETDLQAARSSCEKTRAELETARQGTDFTNQAVTELLDARDAAVLESQNLEAKVKCLEVSLEKMEQRVAAETAKLSDTNSLLVKANADNQELSKDLETANDDLFSKIEQIDVLSNKVISLQGAISSAEETTRSLKFELSTKVPDLEAALVEKEAVVAKLTADIEQVQTKLTQADQIIITKTDLARRMEQDVGDRDYTIKDLHRTIDEMTEQMSKLKEKAEEGRLVIKECDKKSEETGKELANFATQYKDLSERHDVLVAQCSKAESELVYLREEYRSLEMRLESKQSECEALIKDAAASQTVQDDSLFIELRAQIGDLVSQIEVLVAEKEEMISRLEKTAEIKEDYYQKTIALEAQIKEMSLSVSNLEARLEEKEEFAKMESSKLEVATSRLEQLLSEKLVLEKDIKEARDSLATDQLAHASLLEETLSQHREKVDQLVTERVDVVKADMEEETQQLVKQMEEVCQQQVKSLEASITASKVTIKELEEELGVCRAAIEEKRVVLAELSESVKQAESKCKDLEAHLEEKALTPDAEATIDDLRTRLEQATSLSSFTEKQLEEERQRSAEYDSTLSMLQESESRRQQVESEIEDLGARFQSVNNHKDSLMELLEKIKSEKDLLEMKVSDLEMSVKDKEIQSKSEIELLQQEVNAANQLASSLQTDLDIHTAALSDSKSQFEIISAQLDATRLQLLSKLTSLEADLSASKLSAEKKSKDMQTELEKQEKLHKEEMSKVKELQDKVDALEAKLEVAKEDYERLEIQSSASVKEADSLLQENLESGKEIKRLKAQIRKQEQQMKRVSKTAALSSSLLSVAPTSLSDSEEGAGDADAARQEEVSPPPTQQPPPPPLPTSTFAITTNVASCSSLKRSNEEDVLEPTSPHKRTKATEEEAQVQVAVQDAVVNAAASEKENAVGSNNNDNSSKTDVSESTTTVAAAVGGKIVRKNTLRKNRKANIADDQGGAGECNQQ